MVWGEFGDMPIKYRRACLQVCIHKVVYYHAYFLDCRASLAMTEWTSVCFIIPQWCSTSPNLYLILNPRQQSLRCSATRRLRSPVTPVYRVPSRLLASMYTQGCLLSRIFSGLPRFARNDGVDVRMFCYTAMV